MNLGRCFNEAMEVFQKNWLVLIIAGVLFDLLSTVTLFILAGPLTAGACLMTLKALEREDRRAELGDLFGAFDRFFPLVGLFFLTLIATLLGIVVLIVPGLFLATIWIFPFYIAADTRAGVFDALSRSQEMVFRVGFWSVVVLMLVELALGLLPLVVPGVGNVICFVTAPFSWLVVGSAYRQIVQGSGTAAEASPPPAV